MEYRLECPTISILVLAIHTHYAFLVWCGSMIGPVRVLIRSI